MSLLAMQSVLLKLYLDKTFRRRFFSAPEEALGRFRLSPREKAALCGLDREQLEKYCRGLELKNKLLRK